jgi:hypothetical protein
MPRTYNDAMAPYAPAQLAAASPAPPGPLSTFSPLVLLVLVLVLGVSVLMFWILVRRATSHRMWVGLAEWGREAGFALGCHGDGTLPRPFNALPPGPEVSRPAVRLCLSNRRMKLVQFGPAESPFAATPPLDYATAEPDASFDAADVARRGAVKRATAWNVLIRRIEATWPPSALRPAALAPGETGVLDLFSLASFPTLLRPERFVAYGTDTAAARVLARSPVAALLPPDIGLLLHGRQLVLDFSARPFDDTEFDRMIALADSLSAHLPPPPQPSAGSTA